MYPFSDKRAALAKLPPPYSNLCTPRPVRLLLQPRLQILLRPLRSLIFLREVKPLPFFVLQPSLLPSPFVQLRPLLLVRGLVFDNEIEADALSGKGSKPAGNIGEALRQFRGSGDRRKELSGYWSRIGARRAGEPKGHGGQRGRCQSLPLPVC